MRAVLSPERRPILATGLVCLVLYLVAGNMFPNFMTLRVFFNFFADNAFLGVIAVGLTLVILTGGIDLSVGSMAGCASIMAATLVTQKGIPSIAAFGIAAVFGVAVGFAHGFLIARYQLAPFLVTLGGLFFCRGVGLLISRESSPMSDPLVSILSSPAFAIGKAAVSWPAIIFVFVALLMAFVLRQTRFGRTLFAIGGSAPSAHLMGLPVQRSIILAYVLSGLFAALGGILFAIYTASGNAIAGTGLELDAIAAVVIGGTLLTGGSGSILGTVLGVLTIGILQTAIVFQGTLSSWWTKIAIGTLLLIFALVVGAFA
jgi:ribose/xylose/arabinose/galactoside ABC-type transport system permease subunit